MSGQGSRLSLLLRPQRIRNDGTNLLPIKSAVSRELLSGNETPMVRGLAADNNKKLYMDYDLLME